MALERKSRDRQSQQDSSPEHGQRLFNISRQSLQYLSWLFQSWPTDDRWRGSEIFKWCNRSQSTAPYSSPNVYVLAAPSHLTHSFMHTFSKHCPPTLDPAATRCEGLASGERSSCRPPPLQSDHTQAARRYAQDKKCVSLPKRKENNYLSPSFALSPERERNRETGCSWTTAEAAFSRSFWNPCLFKIQTDPPRRIHPHDSDLRKQTSLTRDKYITWW